MIRSPAEISTIMPRLESSTRMEHSKIRREESARYSAESTNVATEPINASTFKNRAKSSTIKLPPKGGAFPGRPEQPQPAVQNNEAHRQAHPPFGSPDAAIGPNHPQPHGARL